jgi:hypothetical protein
VHVTRSLLALCAVLALGGCSLVKKQTPSKFKGDKSDVAATFSTLTSAAKAGDNGKICNQVLSTKLAASFGGRKHCTDTINSVLDDADPTAVSFSVKAVTLGPGKVPTTATASVTSGSGDNTTRATLALVKQRGSWRIDTLG